MDLLWSRVVIWAIKNKYLPLRRNSTHKLSKTTISIQKRCPATLTSHLHQRTTLSIFEKSQMPKSSKVISCSITRVLISNMPRKIMFLMIPKFNQIKTYLKYPMNPPSLEVQTIKLEWSKTMIKILTKTDPVQWTQWG